MPLYTVRAPDGNEYTVNGPPGATLDEVAAAVIRLKPTAGVAPSSGEAAKPQAPTDPLASLTASAEDLAALGVEPSQAPAVQPAAQPAAQLEVKTRVKEIQDLIASQKRILETTRELTKGGGSDARKAAAKSRQPR